MSPNSVWCVLRIRTEYSFYGVTDHSALGLKQEVFDDEIADSDVTYLILLVVGGRE